MLKEKLYISDPCGDIPLEKHLSNCGIKTYSDFENHIKQVDYSFWNIRFQGYNEWKKRAVAEYNQRGYLDMLTGFRCRGPLERNQIVNFPIQGTSFHLLLWSLTQIIKEIKKKKLLSFPVGRVHDSILFDVVPSELQEIVSISIRIMTLDVKEFYPWLNVPLSADAEVSPLNMSWYKKVKYDSIF
jgi:DNA polymerase I-like protein with 3'-5' exonuclease and polymerase domains